MATVVKILGGYLEIEGGGPVDPGFGVPGWPAHPIAPGGKPPFPSQGPGFPTHPIAPGGQPPGIWGGAPPWIDNTLPGGQPTPGWPPVAMPPIYYPGVPGGPPGVISGGPGSLPPWVMPPIAPGGKPPPGTPPGIWGGKPPEWVDNTLPPDQPVAGWPPTIMPPIFYPPNVPPTQPPADKPVEWHTAWTPDKGWVIVGIVTPDAPHPTPSA
jgi:hypothetical protein